MLARELEAVLQIGPAHKRPETYIIHFEGI
jgi:hypothetical protein